MLHLNLLLIRVPLCNKESNKLAERLVNYAFVIKLLVFRIF